nr:unnamed protein product [Callosobruchus chinensis]
MSLIKKNEQHEATLKDYKEKHGKEVAALKYEIKRSKKLDQLQKTGNGCDQLKDENAMLKQAFTQLVAENAYKNENLDNVTAKAINARIKENKSKLREKLTQREAKNKKLKSDVGDAFFV